MKKALIILLMLLIVSQGSKIYAQEIPDKCSFGIAAGGVIPDDEEIDGTFFIGGNFTYGFSDYFAIGAEVGYTSWDHDPTGVEYGEVNATPIFADLYLRYPTEFEGNLSVLYLKTGVGVVLWDYEEADLLVNNGVSVSSQDEVSFKLGGGIDYFVAEDIALNFESAYVWSDANIELPVFATYAATTVETCYWRINTGVKYYF